jgi:hypothetical protein
LLLTKKDLFVKADNKLISVGTDILEDGDEQQHGHEDEYAGLLLEWSDVVSQNSAIAHGHGLHAGFEVG